MSFIEVHDLVIDYPVKAADGTPEMFRALDGVNVTVERGEFLVIVGGNGSGKSTLARSLNALIPPTEGFVKVDGLDTSDPDEMREVRRRVAMVFQNPDHQIVSTIVEDDIAFGPQNLGLPRAEIKERMEESLRLTGLTPYREKGVHHLSGGQKQRVAIAGALAMRPECIIFDESTAMLDPDARASVLRIMHDLHEEGMTILYITHEMEETVQADRILVMHRGRIALEGKPAEVFREEETLEQLGLTLPPAARLARELRMRGVEIPRGILTPEELEEAVCRYKQSR